MHLYFLGHALALLPLRLQGGRHFLLLLLPEADLRLQRAGRVLELPLLLGQALG